MKQFLRDNGLTIALLALFFVTLVGQYFTGFYEYNEELVERGQAAVTYLQYFGEGHFIEATFENWESEFLQMAFYVIFTVFLFQKGSSESKEYGKLERVDFIPAEAKDNPDSPYPVRRGGWLLKIYENSLSIALLLLFAFSFVLHAVGGAGDYNKEQMSKGAELISTLEYAGTARFWFESFQNWQSEFLSVAAMVFLTVYLRQKGSPESKPVDAPHDETGTS